MFVSSSIAAASYNALPAIPAFASGAFSAEDFSGQLESFKAALAATFAGADAQAPVAQTPLTATSAPTSFKPDSSDPEAPARNDSAEVTTPLNVATTAPKSVLRAFAGHQHAEQPAVTPAPSNNQADQFQARPTLVPAYAVKFAESSVAPSPAPETQVPESQPDVSLTLLIPHQALNQNATDIPSTSKKNQHDEQSTAIAVPAKTPTIPIPVPETCSAVLIDQTPMILPHIVSRDETPIPFFQNAPKGTAAISITRAIQSGPPAPLSFAAKIQAPELRQNVLQDAKPSPESKLQPPAMNQSASSTPVAKKAPHEEPAPASSDAAVQSANSMTPNTTLTAGAAISAVDAPAAPTVTESRVETQTVPVAKEPESPSVAEPKSSGGPLKELSFNIAQPGGSTVQLRMVDHAGELRVAVHTASPQLNQDLRADLTDLTKKLSDSGGHSEIWHPDAHGTTASSAAAASKNQGDGAQNNSGNPGGSQQQGRGQRGQDQPQRPKWVEELENGIQSISKSTGETNGLRS